MNAKPNPFAIDPLLIASGEEREVLQEGHDKAAELFASSLRFVKRDKLDPAFLASADSSQLNRMVVQAEGVIQLGGAEHHYDVTATGLGTLQAGYAGPALSLRSVGGERRAARRGVVWADTGEEMRLRTSLKPEKLFSDPKFTAADLGRVFMDALAGTVAIGAVAHPSIAKAPARDRLQWFADAAAAYAALATVSPVTVSWRLPCRPERETTGWAGGVALTGPGCVKVEVEAEGREIRGVASDVEKLLTEVAAGLDVWGYELQLVGGHAIRQAVTIEAATSTATDSEDAPALERVRSLLSEAIGLHGGTAGHALRHISRDSGHA